MNILVLNAALCEASNSYPSLLVSRRAAYVYTQSRDSVEPFAVIVRQSDLRKIEASELLVIRERKTVERLICATLASRRARFVALGATSQRVYHSDRRGTIIRRVFLNSGGLAS